MSTAVDHSQMKLGRKPARRDKRDLMLATYLKALPALAPSRDLTPKMGPDLRMMLNDQYGDCTCAAVGHIIMAWTGNNGSLVVPSDDVILKLYEQWAGYVPGDSSTDNGAVELDILNKWRQQGVTDQNGVVHDLLGHVRVEAKNHDHVKAAVDMFGGAYLGIQLPVAWQTAEIWGLSYQGGDMTPGSWGGHAIVAEAYDDDGLTVITWGMKKRLTWDALDVYCGDENGGEVHACLSSDWAKPGAPCPDGFDIDQLQSDLAAVTS